MSSAPQEQPRTTRASFFRLIDTTESRIWWGPVLRGLLAVIVGFVVILWPAASIRVGVTALGLFAITNGLVAAYCGVIDRGRPGGRTWPVVSGALSVILGAVLIVWPEPVVEITLIIGGVALVLFGISLILAGRRARAASAKGGFGNTAGGITMSVIGVLVALAPYIFASFVVVFLGVGLIVLGLTFIALGFLIRRSLKMTTAVVVHTHDGTS